MATYLQIQVEADNYFFTAKSSLNSLKGKFDISKEEEHRQDLILATDVVELALKALLMKRLGWTKDEVKKRYGTTHPGRLITCLDRKLLLIKQENSIVTVGTGKNVIPSIIMQLKPLAWISTDNNLVKVGPNETGPSSSIATINYPTKVPLQVDPKAPKPG